MVDQAFAERERPSQRTEQTARPPAVHVLRTTGVPAEKARATKAAPHPPPTPSAPSEQQNVLEMLHGRFVDAAPAQAWATLLDEGACLASESTMYRLLRANGEIRERRRQATHPPRAHPRAGRPTRPNRVWSYDVTKLKGPVRGVHYDLFVMLDIYSRYCPGWMVVDQEDGQVAKAWIDRSDAVPAHRPRAPLTIHADRGSSMTSKPVAVLLADLKIGRTHSRPHVTQRQPLQQGRVQDPQVLPCVPRAIRLT